MSNDRFARKLFPFLALTSCLVAVVPHHARADNLPGFTLFSGVDPSNQLSYRLDSGNRNQTDRYRLKIPGSKINSLGAAQIEIVYPEYYQGQFDEKNVEVFVGDKSIPIKGVKWDREQRSLQIDLDKQLRTKREIEVVLNNVKNPEGNGMYYFDCLVKSSPEFPLARKIGTWILSID
jgi:hypothetical protein